MTTKFKGELPKFWAPATYRIEVAGELSQDWADRLGCMQVTNRKKMQQGLVTILDGRVMDQAELTGVINSLYELHLSILSVQIITDSNGA
jgi:hypothetical protein